ncbi:hypothetical protein SERLADRAFT_366764 [Serpula lacrymans var. lacrymans S7.9]|uniref:Uncharacterized protein n=1 Tax=Serpula lacrymans var. lacrymans (strain S7.9) TaxID=578457 RepID=F8NPS4_SERL9|nr:uncharacterized protein SERLADRAFT_366764 [Serpula lacrymans var. lacrymans S7.9]EGO27230.1 hypothetical protein SERLADRAFT_366764 [Serpula lacrymans var. lacrymans S7.9]
MNVFHRSARRSKGNQHPHDLVLGQSHNQAGGYKGASLHPNAQRNGRKHVKHENKSLMRTRIPFLTKVKRALGIHNAPRRRRHTNVLRRNQL